MVGAKVRQRPLQRQRIGSGTYLGLRTEGPHLRSTSALPQPLLQNTHLPVGGVPSQEFLPIRLQLRVIGPRFGGGSRLGLLRPLGENPVAQLTNLLDGSGFRLMRRAALGHQGIDHIGDLEQPLPQVGLSA